MMVWYSLTLHLSGRRQGSCLGWFGCVAFEVVAVGVEFLGGVGWLMFVRLGDGAVFVLVGWWGVFDGCLQFGGMYVLVC